MSFDASMKISASGLSAQRTWMNVISANLANMNTTRTAEGTPYQRKVPIYESVPFENAMGEALGEVDEVEVSDIVSDRRDFVEVYDPGHPDADENLGQRVKYDDSKQNLVPARPHDLVSSRHI